MAVEIPQAGGDEGLRWIEPPETSPYLGGTPKTVDLATVMKRHPFGGVESVLLADGATEWTWERDADDRISNVTTGVLDFSYERNRLGDVVTRTRTYASGATGGDDYGYDALGRLAAWAQGGTTRLEVDYDHAGNRQQVRHFDAGGDLDRRDWYVYEGQPNCDTDSVCPNPDPADAENNRLCKVMELETTEICEVPLGPLPSFAGLNEGWQAWLDEAESAFTTGTPTRETLIADLTSMLDSFEIDPRAFARVVMKEVSIREPLVAMHARFESGLSVRGPLSDEARDAVEAAIDAARDTDMKERVEEEPSVVLRRFNTDYHFDAAGRLVQEGEGPWTVCYSYDGRGRLAALGVPEDPEAPLPFPCASEDNVVPYVRYAYDWKGRRVMRDVPANATRFVALYSGVTDELLLEVGETFSDEESVPLRAHVHFEGRPFAEVELGTQGFLGIPPPPGCGCALGRSPAGPAFLLLGLGGLLAWRRRRRWLGAALGAGALVALSRCGTLAPLSEPRYYYVVTDDLGAPWRMVSRDDPSQIVWLADYQPFGETFLVGDPDADGTVTIQPLRFPGQAEDVDRFVATGAPGLHYNWHRYYDPQVGRYAQVDPLAIGAPQVGGTDNPFAYAGSTPLVATDPTGLIIERPPAGPLRNALERLLTVPCIRDLDRNRNVFVFIREGACPQEAAACSGFVSRRDRGGCTGCPGCASGGTCTIEITLTPARFGANYDHTTALLHELGGESCGASRGSCPPARRSGEACAIERRLRRDLGLPALAAGQCID